MSIHVKNGHVRFARNAFRSRRSNPHAFVRKSDPDRAPLERCQPRQQPFVSHDEDDAIGNFLHGADLFLSRPDDAIDVDEYEVVRPESIRSTTWSPTVAYAVSFFVRVI